MSGDTRVGFMTVEAGAIGTRARERCGGEQIDLAGGCKILFSYCRWVQETTCIKYLISWQFLREKLEKVTKWHNCFVLIVHRGLGYFWNLLVMGS